MWMLKEKGGQNRHQHLLFEVPGTLFTAAGLGGFTQRLPEPRSWWLAEQYDVVTLMYLCNDILETKDKGSGSL